MLIEKTKLESNATSIFKKRVRVSLKDYAFLVKTKGKKSIAGRLEEIVKFHIEKIYKEKK